MYGYKSDNILYLGDFFIAEHLMLRTYHKHLNKVDKLVSLLLNLEV